MSYEQVTNNFKQHYIPAMQGSREATQDTCNCG